MIRRWFRIAGIVLGVIVCVPLHYLWRLFGARSPWPRRFLFWVGYASGLRVTVRGSFRRNHVMFVSNHVSWLDIMAIGGTAGAAFVAKAELGSVGFIRWLADLNDTLYIQRSDRGALHGQAEMMREVLARGRAVSLFPEATTAGGRAVLPFRPSLLSALYPPIPGVIVQPIALDYGALDADVAWDVEPGDVNARRLLERPGTIPLVMTFLDPLTPGPDLDRKRLAALSRDAVVAALRASDTAAAPLYGGR